MGWISERMEALTPPLESFSELARRVRAARSWPAKDSLKASSLAIYLRKLDEGQELERIEQRPGVLTALAEVLGMTGEDMEEQLLRLLASQSESIPPLKLHDMPVRPIDLREDPLPPGIPPQVASPEHWPLWWHAPSGSGRTWVGRWLEARQRAAFIQAPTWADAERQLPSEGAVFIELGSAEGAPLHDRWAPTLKVCVAAEAYPPQLPPAPAQAGKQEQPEGWRRVENQPVRNWLLPLMEWLKERATGGGFDTQACLRWLVEKQVLPGEHDLGTVLGLIGLYATYAQKSGPAGALHQAKSRGDLARFFIRMRKQQVEEATVQVDALWQNLRGMGQRLLLEEGSRWYEARSLEDWQTLVPTKLDASHLDWLQEVGALGLSVDPAKLKKARERLPLDAFKTVRALRDLGLLREREPQVYAFRPRWVLEGILEQSVYESIDREPAGTWGMLLLRQEWAALAMQHVLLRCRQGQFEFIERLVAAPDTESPAWVAALEASFRTLGMASLEGVHLPEPLRRGVLQLQRRLLVPSYDGAPQPRLPYAHPLAQEHLLLGDEVWYASLLILTEPLAPADALSLDSWCRGLPPEAIRWLAEMGRMERGDKEIPDAWVMPLLLLGSRLFERIMPTLQSGGSIPELIRLEYLLRFLRQDPLSLTELERVLPWGRLVGRLPEYARQRGVDWKPLAQKVWAVWLAQEGVALPNFLWHQNPVAKLFWSEVPPQAIRRFISPHLHNILQHEESYAFFKDEHWEVFVEEWAALKQSWWGDAPSTAWKFIPSSHVRKALQAGLPDPWDHETRRALWERWPEVLCEEVDSLFKQGRWDPALTQAWAVPPPFFERVLDSAEKALAKAEKPPPTALARWLRDEIRMRVPGWERAWKLLERLVPTVASPSA